MPLRRLSVVLFLVAITACGPSHEGPEASEVAGKILSFTGQFKRPPAKSIEELKIFSQKLGDFFRIKKALPNASSSAKGKQALFGAYFLKALVACGGIPRQQGEKVVKTLVSPQSQACGGVSCAAVFGVTEKEVSPFFDDLLDQAGTSKELAKQDNQAHRQKIIGSLVSSESYQKPSKSIDYVKRIYEEIPVPVFASGNSPQEILSREDIMEKTNLKFIAAAYDYTSKKDYFYIRQIESMPREALEKEGMNPQEMDAWTRKSNLLSEGMKKLPVVQAAVYRGMQDLSARDIASWYRAWKSQQPIGLGFGDRPATTSTSWHVYGATGFLSKHILRRKTPKKFAVLIEIKSHRGVSIQNISAAPQEFEVLLPRDQKVIIESIAPMEGVNRAFIIKMRGVDSVRVNSSRDLELRRTA